LLTLATPRRDCKVAAKALLEQFQTLQGVFEASPAELTQVKDVGSVNTLGIRLIKAGADRYLEHKLVKKNAIHNAKDLFDYLYFNMKDRRRECFKVIFLDARNKILSAKTLFEGTITSSSVYPREVVQAALENKAAALIFAHNHPSGDPSPSPEDVAITRQLIFACRVMNITVHEHIVIGDNSYFSFADQGYISEMNREFDRKT
jgi:DNA repair protein RadC